ncbi:hypothetical protein B0H14DRAFT_2556954 [Mycena olivaceomarginata]|nr:hypothetical protein B0H14DRAFT_2556954 [Mycena olivaceomarginata]
MENTPTVVSGRSRAVFPGSHWPSSLNNSGVSFRRFFISWWRGKTRRGHVVVPNRLSLQELATEFFAQIRDHGLAQVVWGHGRVIRPQEALLNRSFIAIEKCVSLPGGGELVYDVVQPYGTGWLSLFHWLQLTRYYNFLHRPTDDFRNLITFLRPAVCGGRK